MTMLTLDDHNRKMADEQRLRDTVENNAGVLCPKGCGKEMLYCDPGMMQLTKPPKRAVQCYVCGYRGFKTE